MSLKRVDKWPYPPNSDDELPVEPVGIDVDRLKDAMYLAGQRGLIYDGITNSDEAEIYARLYDDSDATPPEDDPTSDPSPPDTKE